MNPPDQQGAEEAMGPNILGLPIKFEIDPTVPPGFGYMHDYTGNRVYLRVEPSSAANEPTKLLKRIKQLEAERDQGREKVKT